MLRFHKMADLLLMYFSEQGSKIISFKEGYPGIVKKVYVFHNIKI